MSSKVHNVHDHSHTAMKISGRSWISYNLVPKEVLVTFNINS